MRSASTRSKSTRFALMHPKASRSAHCRISPRETCAMTRQLGSQLATARSTSLNTRASPRLSSGRLAKCALITIRNCSAASACLCSTASGFLNSATPVALARLRSCVRHRHRRRRSEEHAASIARPMTTPMATSRSAAISGDMARDCRISGCSQLKACCRGARLTGKALTLTGSQKGRACRQSWLAPVIDETEKRIKAYSASIRRLYL
jgi:hypothetical protein